MKKRFKKGDLLYIHTDGTYRCIIADEHIAVFAAWRYDKLHLEFLRARSQDGKPVPFDDSDLIEYYEDIAYND